MQHLPTLLMLSERERVCDEALCALQRKRSLQGGNLISTPFSEMCLSQFRKWTHLSFSRRLLSDQANLVAPLLLLVVELWNKEKLFETWRRSYHNNLARGFHNFPAKARPYSVSLASISFLSFYYSQRERGREEREGTIN